MLVGLRDVRATSFSRAAQASEARTVLSVDDVSVRGERGRAGLSHVSLHVDAGEIVGVAGVTGNGQSELGEVVLGRLSPDHGHVYLEDVDVTRWSTAKILAHGVGVIPEDPLRMGVAPGLTVTENMVLNERRRFMPGAGLYADWRAIRRAIEARIENFGLAIPRLTLPVGTLSGGNVQRLLLLREIGRRPKLLVAFYPTRGLDIAATRMAHDLLVAARNAGAAILVVSEDLDELFALCDRLVVFSLGTVVGTFKSGDVDAVEVGLRMTGGGKREAWSPSPA